MMSPNPNQETPKRPTLNKYDRRILAAAMGVIILTVTLSSLSGRSRAKQLQFLQEQTLEEISLLKDKVSLLEQNLNLASQPSNNDDLAFVVEDIRRKIEELSDSQKPNSSVLGISQLTDELEEIISGSNNQSSVSKKTITISENSTNTVDIFEHRLFSSSIVGQANPGKTYPYDQEQDGWYLIEIGNKKGWIHERYTQNKL